MTDSTAKPTNDNLFNDGTMLRKQTPTHRTLKSSLKMNARVGFPVEYVEYFSCLLMPSMVRVFGGPVQ